MYIKAIENEDTSNDIYEVFLKDMSKKYLKETSSDEKVIDYISSMTDNYIKIQYEKYVSKKGDK